MQDIPTATTFLAKLNKAHPSINFAMEVALNNKLPFIGMELGKMGSQVTTCMYRKTTGKGLLLQSHVDNRCKQSLPMTMLKLIMHIDSHPQLIFLLVNVITWKRYFLSLRTLRDWLILQSIDSLSHKTKNKHLIFKLISPFRLFYPLKISDQLS